MAMDFLVDLNLGCGDPVRRLLCSSGDVQADHPKKKK
jgi:hypothetical protein